MLSATIEPSTVVPVSPEPTVIPAQFRWTELEERKIDQLGQLLHCSEDVVRQLLVFFLRYLAEKPRGVAVEKLPELFASFPVKWGYKRKRNDFLKLLAAMDFIYVKFTFRPGVRAKTYAPAKAGLDLLGRLTAEA